MSGETPAGLCRRAYTALQRARDRLAPRRARGRQAASCAADCALRGAALAAGELPAALRAPSPLAGDAAALAEASRRKLRLRSLAACAQCEALLAEAREDVEAAERAADALEGAVGEATARQRPLFACLPASVLLGAAREAAALLRAELEERGRAVRALGRAAQALHGGRGAELFPPSQSAGARERLALMVAAWATDDALRPRRLDDILRDADSDMKGATRSYRG